LVNIIIGLDFQLSLFDNPPNTIFEIGTKWHMLDRQRRRRRRDTKEERAEHSAALVAYLTVTLLQRYIDHHHQI
jgi:hypothetical protein